MGLLNKFKQLAGDSGAQASGSEINPYIITPDAPQITKTEAPASPLFGPSQQNTGVTLPVSTPADTPNAPLTGLNIDPQAQERKY